MNLIQNLVVVSAKLIPLDRSLGTDSTKFHSWLTCHKLQVLQTSVDSLPKTFSQIGLGVGWL